MPAEDKFASHQAGLQAPAASHIEVTPSDSTDLVNTSRGIYSGSGGTIVIVDSKGVEAVYRSVPAGVILPIRASSIRANYSASPTESTSATGIIALS